VLSRAPVATDTFRTVCESIVRAAAHVHHLARFEWSEPSGLTYLVFIAAKIRALYCALHCYQVFDGGAKNLDVAAELSHGVRKYTSWLDQSQQPEKARPRLMSVMPTARGRVR
ncbi:hypothetical protein EVAR_68248_1, partial [Eumeta japonica]